MKNNNNDENEPSVHWEDVTNDGSLENFARTLDLRSESLQFEDGVLILPQNKILHESSDNQNLFPGTTKDVMMTLKEGGVPVHLYEDGRSRRELVLKSADIILPIVMFLSDPAVAIGLNLISNWIYDRWIMTKTKNPPSMRVEYVEIKDKKSVLRWRRVEGPAEDVRNLLIEEARLRKENQIKQ